MKLGYALHSGEMFKKVKNSEYTYQHCCSVKKFLSLLGCNNQFKDTIIKHLNKLVEILGNRECEFVKQQCVNYDLIEVNGGWCFSISQRKFVSHPIKSTKISKESPRAYIDYEHTKTPDPSYFKQILQNNLNKQEMAHFCKHYIRLLNCSTKQHKERVVCLVGEPNSEKRSLFIPISCFIPARYTAMISKQKAFNKSLVDENTQIIFLDEAYAKLMDPDDWKILAQVQDVKSSSHKTSNVYNVSDGYGFWPGAQRRHGHTLKKVLLQKLDITACSGSTRILTNPCNGLYCLGMQPGDHSRQ